MLHPAAPIVDALLRRFERTADPYPLIRWLTAGGSEHPLDFPRLVADLQLIRLRRMVRYAGRRSPYYRELFGRLGFRPGEIRSADDLRHLPMTTSHDLAEWQRFIAVPDERLSTVFTTSGSSGEPKRVYYTNRELNALHNISALGLRLRFSGPLRALVALPDNLWIGAAEGCAVVRRAGGLALPVGIADPAEVIFQMRRFQPTFVITSPSFMVVLTREAQRQGYRLELGGIMVSGEPLIPVQQELFRDYWRAPTCNSYGTTEIGGAQTIALPDSERLYLNGLHLYTEIIDPASGEPAEEGELVFTPLEREAMPLLRYRSGDLARWDRQTSHWLPFGSILLGGRSDDLLVVNDMNLFGHILAEAAGRAPGATGRIAITVDKVDMVDRLTLRVEGQGVDAADVRERLLAVYPELMQGIQNGGLLLVIEPDAQLGGQLKALQLHDARRSLSH